MAGFNKLSALLVVMALGYLLAPSTEGFVLSDCYDTWSRCSGWSPALTGILWNTCSERCQCLGHADGACHLAQTNCGEAYQCQCHGTLNGPRPSNCKF
uniref:Theromacin n=1 Tax=Sinohyriopsis cumingii TaxID=165450 RepID=C4P9M6_SINCU|nr:theromacin [Sinohyriopsis cumingii]